MDSRLIPFLLAAGWLLLVLGLWGAFRVWWVWPLALGIALLAIGAAYGWAFTVALRRGGSGAPGAPAEAAK